MKFCTANQVNRGWREGGRSIYERYVSQCRPARHASRPISGLNIGSRAGGLVPFITTAAYTATGSVAYAMIYPIAVPAVCFVLSLFLMPETRHMKIWEPEAVKA